LLNPSFFTCTHPSLAAPVVVTEMEYSILSPFFFDGAGGGGGGGGGGGAGTSATKAGGGGGGGGGASFVVF